PDRVPDADPRTEVGQVGSAFNRMLGHVEAALGRRAASETRLRRFAADASHELRTPLAAIRGYAELARRHPGPVPADAAGAGAPGAAGGGRASRWLAALSPARGGPPAAKGTGGPPRPAHRPRQRPRGGRPRPPLAPGAAGRAGAGARRRTPPASGPGQPD